MHDREIINAVRRYPELWYKNQCTVGDAALAWEEIACELHINGNCTNCLISNNGPL